MRDTAKDMDYSESSRKTEFYKEAKAKMEIKTICYGQTRLWDNRDDAIKFFAEAIACSEGSERERYAIICSSLLDGEMVCTDEY